MTPRPTDVSRKARGHSNRGHQTSEAKGAFRIRPGRAAGDSPGQAKSRPGLPDRTPRGRQKPMPPHPCNSKLFPLPPPALFRLCGGILAAASGCIVHHLYLWHQEAAFSTRRSLVTLNTPGTPLAIMPARSIMTDTSRCRPGFRDFSNQYLSVLRQLRHAGHSCSPAAQGRNSPAAFRRRTRAYRRCPHSRIREP